LIFLSIRLYTRHGQALTVPDFIGMKIDEVEKLADEKHLNYEINDSVFIQGQAPGTVISQSPLPDTKVKAYRTIFLTINALNPEKIEMPNVVGVSLRQAEAILTSKGLRIGFKKYIPDIAKDYVLKQLCNNREIAGGTTVVKGAVIDLVLGMGAGGGTRPVPSLIGLTRGAAQEELSANYLNFGVVAYDNSVETRQDSLRAVIWKQSPSRGGTINSGEPVDVWLTVDETKVKTDSISK
jgi:Uncharacterized protein conserved in bacteria